MGVDKKGYGGDGGLEGYNGDDSFKATAKRKMVEMRVWNSDLFIFLKNNLIIEN